jgi:hypothetical protein
MSHICYLGDGARDNAVLPHLVRSLLGADFPSTFQRWAHLRVGGFARKLKFAAIAAIEDKELAIVAVVDRDKAEKHERLLQLKSARDQVHAKDPDFPIAIGEANPHGEAWLLDDPIALRQVLRLKDDITIPSVITTCNPKSELQNLIDQSPENWSSTLEAMTAIAEEFQHYRCDCRGETGLAEFVEDVLAELKWFRA